MRVPAPLSFDFNMAIDRCLNDLSAELAREPDVVTA